MILSKVTITGADDKIDDVSLLFELSDEFPLIEWGILIYPEKEGKPRYPTEDWRRIFMKWKPGFVKAAGHLCGSAVTNFFVGNSTDENLEAYGVYDRIQLNFRYDGKDPVGKTTKIHSYLFMSECEKRAIVQHNDQNEEFIKFLKNYLAPSWRPLILFDSSGGKGKVPTTLLKPLDGFKCGYAGGIDPDNVGTVLSNLTLMLPENMEVWIDMESGVRTNNEFDLEKVRDVMEQVTDFGS